MKLVIEKATLEFPATLSLKGLPIFNGNKLDAVWRAKTLPDLYAKLRDYTNLNIELMLPEELLTNNKYGLPQEDINELQKEENLALIRYIDELLVLRLELFTPPEQVLENLLNTVCEKVNFFTIDSDRDEVINLLHTKPMITPSSRTYH